MSAVKRYRVKPGHKFGVGKKHQAGDIVRLTEYEAQGFLDKLDLVEDEPQPMALANGVAGDPGLENKPAPDTDEDSALLNTGAPVPQPDPAAGAPDTAVSDGQAGQQPGASTDEDSSIPTGDEGADQPADPGAGDNDDEDAPALDLQSLWATQAPGINPRVAEVMIRHNLAPAVVKLMEDKALLALDGIGPSTVRALREAI